MMKFENWLKDKRSDEADTVIHRLDEMAVIARVGSSESDLKIAVFGKEGSIPHFHVIKGRFQACVRFETAEYFTHAKHPHKLKKGMPEIVDRILREKDDPSGSNWQFAIRTWNINNPRSKQLRYDLLQPDYTKLQTS